MPINTAIIQEVKKVLKGFGRNQLYSQYSEIEVEDIRKQLTDGDYEFN